MEPDSWPIDQVSLAVRVLQVIDNIDASDEEQRDALLGDLMAAAWGSFWAQLQ